MKISLWLRHDGLGRLLMNLLSDHEVVAAQDADNWVYKVLGLPYCDGTEDVRISTTPHYDLGSYGSTKPVVAYVTNPIYPAARPFFEQWLGKRNFHPIGVEDCYSESAVVPYKRLIPYALVGYPRYNPTIDKVLVVNRRPEVRLREITKGALREEYTVARMMGNLPYIVARQPNLEKFKRMYADYKVLFYFSNSPFTIVMWEAMTVGMPVVAYNAAIKRWTGVIERLFPHRGTDPDEIRRMLREELDRDPPSLPIEYDILAFSDVKQMWNDLLESVA